jgi:hypothetical protein
MSDVPPLGAYLQLKLSVERCSLAYACKSTTMLAGSSRDNSLNLVVFSNFFIAATRIKINRTQIIQFLMESNRHFEFMRV